MLKRAIIKRILIIKNKPKRNIFESLIYFIYFLYQRTKQAIYGSNSSIVGKGMYLYRHSRNKVMGDKYQFVSFEQLIYWMDEFVNSLEERFDLIVGIPRSGLLVANYISLKLGIPLTTTDRLNDMPWKSNVMPDKKYKNILLIDDSISTGNTLHEHKKYVEEFYKNANIKTAAIITSSEGQSIVDMYQVVLPRMRRLFEWNMMHAKKGVIAFDLDGVLCEEPPEGIELDINNYQHWLKIAKPYLIPSFKIDTIITNRLEKYRDITEKWLQKYDVQYDRLVMWDLSNPLKRKEGDIVRHKVKHLLDLKPYLFLESSPKESYAIWKQTKIPVLSVSEKKILN